MESKPKLRVGVVPYLNMLPFTHGLRELGGDAMEVIGVPPALMADRMDAGEIDVGMVPVAALLERPDWRVVGRSMIGSRGPVLSVLLISKYPTESWTTIHLDSQSRTSNVLAQVLLRSYLGLSPRIGESIPAQGWSPPEETERGEAFLVIGDRALQYRGAYSASAGVALDLGHFWTEWTGLPFVYALWAARPGVELGDWMERIDEHQLRNRGRLEEIIAAKGELKDERLTAEQAATYLTENIVFDLDEQALAGLERFHEEGRRLGLFKRSWDASRLPRWSASRR